MDEQTAPQAYDEDVAEDLPEEDLPYDDGGEDDFVQDAVASVVDSGDEPVEQIRGLVTWLVQELVDEPENVNVDVVERGSSVQVQVRLPEADLGKIIGRGGRIAKSIRTALMIVGSRHHMRVSLDIEGLEPS